MINIIDKLPHVKPDLVKWMRNGEMGLRATVRFNLFNKGYILFFMEQAKL